MGKKISENGTDRGVLKPSSASLQKQIVKFSGILQTS